MSDFIDRLKHARIVRILAFYLGASWVILQVVDVLRESLALPEWVAPVSVILLLIGLVIISATAMVQAEVARAPVPGPASASEGETGLPAPGSGGGSSGDLPASDVARLFTWKRAVAGGVLAFVGLFAVAGVAVMLTGGAGIGPEEIAADEAGLGVAVLPFAVTGPEMDVWAEGMVDLLADNLDGTGGLRTIDPRTVMSRWRDRVDAGESPDLETMLDIARTTGARYAVVGSAVALGDEVRLSTDVYDILSGEPMGAGAVEGSTDDVMSMVDRLSVETASAVLATGGGELPSLRHTTSLTTRSPDALRAYLEGEAMYRTADFAGAADAFRRAVAEDSTFALANLRLSRALGWLRNIGDDEAFLALERALAFEDRLPPREAELLGIEQLLETQDFDALAQAASATRNYPDDPEAWELLGEAYYHQGDQGLVSLEESLQPFLKAIDLDPTFSPIYFHPIEITAGMGDSAQAYGLLEDLQTHSTDDGRAGRYDVFLDLVLGSPDSREAAVLRIREEVPDRELFTGYFFGFRRTPRSVPGDLAIAEEFRRRGAADTGALLEQSARLTEGRLEQALDLAFAAELGGDLRISLLMLLQWTAWREVPNDPRVRSLVMDGECSGSQACYVTAILAAELGAWERHGEALDTYAQLLAARVEEALATESDDGEQEVERLREEALWIDVARAYGQLRRGEVDVVPEAFRVARTIQPFASWSHNSRNQALRWWTAELLLAQGQAEQAARYYDSLWGAPLGAWFTVRMVGLGDAHRAIGQVGEARRHYQAFLEAWREADPEHVLVRRAQEGLDALGEG
jgi:tetratricopeptide (TPR) repeat protein/TolB-like protein